MSPLAPAETLAADGCRIVLRRVDGPEARELFLTAEPAGARGDASAQAEAMFAAIEACLASEGASGSQVKRETVFLASMTADLEVIRSVRARFVDPSLAPVCEIEQPPLAEGARLLVSLHAVIPDSEDRRADRDAIRIDSACPCSECANPVAIRRATAGEVGLDGAVVYGTGGDALAQTRSAFERAEALLERAGLDFGDVVRTWIHLRDIDRDYDALNQGRRAFFAERGIDPPPASTGIGGGPASPSHALCLGFEALRREGGAAPVVMHAPTLNEAPEYGADFVRGLRVDGANGTTLHVSGTASVDEAGRTAHPGDIDAQGARMLLNLRTLLERQGAGAGDVASAITYVKRRADAERVRAAFSAAGFRGFPHVLVEAPVCRPDLLCETELIARLPSREA